MPKKLPTNPNLENLKKQAKQLVKDFKTGQVEAFGRIKGSFPPLADATVHDILTADFSLCNAQLVVAREYGIATWKDLVAAVERPREGAYADAFAADNPSLEWVRGRVQQAAALDLPVLVTGESGSGKGLIARAVHRLSGRQAGPCYQVNCRAEPLLVDSELFGHEAGAFTGAHVRRLGKVEVARGGTLLLDGVEALAPAVQARLFELLTEGQFERVGGTERLDADVRIIALADGHLVEAAADGRFQPELAHVLQKVTIEVPPLRQCLEELPQLAAHFIGQMAELMGRQAPELSPEALNALQAHTWPGNVRELEYRVQQAVMRCEGPVIEARDIALD